MEMNIKEKLSMIQQDLKAPKNQFNKFGNYKYRNCEDILEAVKPLCNKYRTTLTIEDMIVVYGDRTYVKAVTTLSDWDSEVTIATSALARESASKKGMDDAQVTGATSSYARKYALNGLFNIDDTKDADTDEYTAKTQNRSNNKVQDETPVQHSQTALTEEQIKRIMIDNATLKATLDSYHVQFREDDGVMGRDNNEVICRKAGVPTQNILELTPEQVLSLNKEYERIIMKKRSINNG